MKIEILYKSKRNTKKIAEVMGKVLNVQPKALNSRTNIESADILFLGCGIYAGDVHKDVKNFIDRLNADNIKKIVLFSTSGNGTDQMQLLKDKIKEHKINLEEKTFCCKGRAMIFANRNHPDNNDYICAEEFARSFL